MNQPSTDWRSVRHALQKLARPVAVRSADVFWREFNARRVLHPQRLQVARTRTMSPLLFPGLAVAAVIMLLAGGLLLLGRSGRAGPSVVRAYSVGGRYTSVMLLTDESAPATILWVSGMEAGEEQGDS